MTVEVKINPQTKKIIVSTINHGDVFKAGIREGLFEIGKEVQKEVRRIIQTGSRTGRVYRIRGKDHKASAPHEAPANRTGRLSSSVNYRVRGHSQVEIGDKVNYGKYLEYGTRKMRGPRPHLLKAVNNKHAETIMALSRYVRNKIK